MAIKIAGDYLAGGAAGGGAMVLLQQPPAVACFIKHSPKLMKWLMQLQVRILEHSLVVP